MKRQINFTTTVALAVPQIPNFIRVVGDEKTAFAIQDLDQDTLGKIADAWKTELLEAAANRHKERER